MQVVAQDTRARAAVGRKRSAPLAASVADRLLELLSSDDAYRELFMRDPREALSQAGFVNHTELASPHFCFMGIRQLASKQVVRPRAPRSV